jgi:CRISPR-associated endonuclease/helicase Cas3
VHERKQINPDSVDERKGFGKPKPVAKPLKEMTQNELRNFVRRRVVDHLKVSDILSGRIFTLAAPTGIGKTMTALDFMLK